MTRNCSSLRILHSNDIHSHFERMPRIASLFNRLRDEAGAERTLTLDIGDHMDRMRPETEGTQGAANIDVLEATGYDAITLGNNEGLTFTADVLQERYGEEHGFRVVLANMYEAAAGRLPEWASPSCILTRQGVRIGLIGVTADFSDFYSLLGWHMLDPMEQVERWVKELRPEVDVLIVMSHLGLRKDEWMASHIDGIDVILGGHTHHLLEEPLRIGGALVCAAGKFGQYVGVVDLEVEPGRGVVHAEGRVLPVDGESPDPGIADIIERRAAEASRVLEREVAKLASPLPSEWDRESPLGNVLAAGLRRWVGADIGLVNAGQLLEGLPAGTVTASDLLRLCPSPINPCRMRLTGGQLLQALEESLLPEYTGKPIYGFGFRGKVLGTLCVDGLTVEYDPAGPELGKIRSVLVGDRPLELEASYKIGTIDMFTFGIGYMSISQGTEVEYYLPEFLRDVLLRELNDAQGLKDSTRMRWKKVKI
ncbi:bifunctional UDP-sugar hydrolase/5'-nucleotidase [Paenibacillus filicis]|uniref:Bifunctional UDP-sugar hydrolase/5'-nucleotidase n=1 Tax=Paenibacillus gyeongsangnamensis TaxID=3388067 RepID=A0ABT4Q9L8_9BACL|nr:bifunctional UDP-sugar hydrolase/5'-nucleotidase [Paenibacillus filicis]MCZ8513457.1 bifunctional UDP-sugar hydrolase/5'-nucleotidase [Paenibacillus filicis]